MQRQIAIGVLAGIASASLYTALVWLPALGLASEFVSPLPLMLAGLSSGVASLAVAALVAAIIALAVAGIGPAVNFIVALALPAALVVYLALHKRTVKTQSGELAVEWYPAGRLLAALTFLAAGFLCAAALMTAGEPDGLRGAAKATLLELFGGRENLAQLLAENQAPLSVDQYIDFLASIFPALACMRMVGQIALNAGLAQRFLAARGHAIRPSPTLRDLSLPIALDVALGIAVIMSVLPGSVGFLGVSLVALFLLPYFLLGLVVVHDISTGWPSRGLILVAFYLALLVLSALAVVIAGLGVWEACFGLRRRIAAAKT